jgi:LEA14-like dessication related protein
MYLIASSIACSSIPTHKPLPPNVEIESVKLERFGLREQELAFTLNVYNPNKFDLPLDSLDFIASYQGQSLAQGQSTTPVKLPALANAVLDINVNTRIDRVLLQFMAAAADNQDELDLSVEGSVKLSNWPARIPFSVDKQIQNPVLPD